MTVTDAPSKSHKTGASAGHGNANKLDLDSSIGEGDSQRPSVYFEELAASGEINFDDMQFFKEMKVLQRVYHPVGR
jgi:hypothetical protein